MNYKILFIISLLFLLSVQGAFADDTGHYINGIEGIKAGSPPPPGFYYRLYNVFYSADTLKDENGNPIDANLDIGVFANVHRFVWITEKEILGADYGANVIIPLVYTDFAADTPGGRVTDDKFGLYDIIVEPVILGWHGERYDAVAAMGVILPVGNYDPNNPASPGKGYWTGMATLGGTYYLDEEKTWSASILSRYEIHSRIEDSTLRPGANFHFEWGLAKMVQTESAMIDIGVAGYCGWQVTDDRGIYPGGIPADEVHDKIFAIGPEVNIFVPSKTLFISFKSEWEFGAVDRPEGNITCITLTKQF